MRAKRPNRFLTFVNSAKVVAGLLVLTTLGCAAGTVVAYQHAAGLRDHGVRTIGEVVEVHDSGKDNHVVVLFRDNQGAEVSADVGNYLWDPTPRVGDHPELIFDPEDPKGNVADVRMGPDFFSVWALVLGAAIAGVLIVPTWTGRLDWNELRR